MAAARCLPGRPATGVLGNGLSVRAFAVSDGGSSFAIADIESQGWFAAIKNGPYGLVDMRKEVERRTGGVLRAENVVIQSDHSHSGPDALGVWGGVPDEYLATSPTRPSTRSSRRSGRWLRPRSTTARRRAATCSPTSSTTTRPTRPSTPTCGCCRRATATGTLVTLLNFSAHTTVLGSSNTKASGDWVQAANPLLEQRFGGKAVTVVGTLGRTQPGDRGCTDPDAVGEDAQNLCKINDYATRVVDRAAQAAANAQPLGGDPVVSARSYLVQDPATNALILGMEYAGGPIGIPLMRSQTPPWLTGERARHGHGDGAHRRRAAVGRAGRDVSADRVEGRGARRARAVT